MAPRSTIDSYDWDNDYAEMTATGAATAADLTGVSLSNHSYGYGANSDDMGRYEKEAQTVDALVWAMPYYLPLWAAGNEQDSSPHSAATSPSPSIPLQKTFSLSEP